MTNKDIVKTNRDSGLMGGFPTITRLNDVVSSVHGLMDTFMNGDFDIQFFSDIQPHKSNFPKIDVYETEDSYDVEIAVAGYNKDDVDLELKDNAFIIKADVSTSDEDCDDDKRCIRREISRRSFRRFVRFPRKIDASNVNCKYDNGIIYCSIGKLKDVNNGSVKIEIA